MFNNGFYNEVVQILTLSSKFDSRANAMIINRLLYNFRINCVPDKIVNFFLKNLELYCDFDVFEKDILEKLKFIKNDFFFDIEYYNYPDPDKKYNVLPRPWSLFEITNDNIDEITNKISYKIEFIRINDFEEYGLYESIKTGKKYVVIGNNNSFFPLNKKCNIRDYYKDIYFEAPRGINIKLISETIFNSYDFGRSVVYNNYDFDITNEDLEFISKDYFKDFPDIFKKMYVLYKSAMICGSGVGDVAINEKSFISLIINTFIDDEYSKGNNDLKLPDAVLGNCLDIFEKYFRNSIFIIFIIKPGPEEKSIKNLKKKNENNIFLEFAENIIRIFNKCIYIVRIKNIEGDNYDGVISETKRLLDDIFVDRDSFRH